MHYSASAGNFAREPGFISVTTGIIVAEWLDNG
jgi:hypothetical protein